MARTWHVAKRMAYLASGCMCATGALGCLLAACFVLDFPDGQLSHFRFSTAPWGTVGLLLGAAAASLCLACLAVRALRGVDKKCGPLPTGARVLLYLFCIAGAGLLVVLLWFAGRGPGL